MERRQIKTLCSDNRSEYTSSEFTSYLTEEGIKHELTTPHPQQNGVAERLNHTLIEGVCSMLANSKLQYLIDSGLSFVDDCVR